MLASGRVGCTDYERFIARFEPMLIGLQVQAVCMHNSVFLLRTLLIHEFGAFSCATRSCRNPNLPGLAGLAARTLCKQLYERRC